MKIYKMNSKKANWLFLSVVLAHIALIVGLIAFSQFLSLGIIENLIVSQMIIVIPAVLFLLPGKKEEPLWKELGIRKVRISTIVATVLYTGLCMPLVTVVNAVSMLFVDNTVTAMSTDILEVPFPVMMLIIAVLGPACEELVFRGIFFSSYKKDGSTMGAILLSALVFGLMHMNFNQAGYAFVIGIALALLVTATGSIWPAIFSHFLINAQSVCSMYLMDFLEPGSVQAESAMVTRDMLYFTIAIYGMIAAVTTVLAICLLIWMAGREGGREEMKKLWKKPENSQRRITAPLIVASVISILYMVLEAMLMRLV